MSGFRLGDFAPTGMADSISGLPLGPAIETLKGIAANGHRQVLVVGGTSTIPPELRDHSQIVWWDLKDRDTPPPPIPKMVSLVVMTRFIRHVAMFGLKEQCKARSIMMVNQPLQTGQLKNLLRILVKDKAPQADEEKEAGMSDAIDRAIGQTVRTFGRGELAAFVAKHADLSRTPYVLEARRLHQLAAEEGFTTTEDSIAQSMTQARRVLAEPEAVRVPPVVAEPLAQPVPQVAQQQAAAVQAAVLQDDDAELVRMINDALATLELVKQTVVERAGKRAQLRELMKFI